MCSNHQKTDTKTQIYICLECIVHFHEYIKNIYKIYYAFQIESGQKWSISKLMKL